MNGKNPKPRKYDLEKWEASKLWCQTCGKGKRYCKCEKPKKKAKK